MRRIALSFLTVIMILSLITPTRSIYAVPESVIGGAAQAAIDAAISGASAVPAVPTTDTVNAVKEVKLCMWGVCIPGLDKIAITMVKQVLERMVDSTVEWINSGFDGNPAYVTDPKQYFTDLADGVAGEFIGDVTSRGTPLDFLCSPFKAQIKLSLRTQYTKSDQFQCTLTGIVGNIDSFYNDFSQGGWDAWFSMTQNSDNNPYGAYLGAKIELDSRLASAIGLENKQLDWGSGFLSYQPCVVHEDVYSFPDNGGAPTRTTGKCLVKGPIQTPGTAIEDGLSHVLGSGVRQLELADEFDELVGALVARALQDTVLGATGLFNAKKVSSEPVAIPNIPTLPSDSTGNANQSVRHEVFSKNNLGLTQVNITATLPNLPSGADLIIRVDGADRYSCRFNPCTYANTYQDGSYTYDAYYLVNGEITEIAGGAFAVPLAATPEPVTGTGEFSNLLSQVQAERAKYGATTSCADLGKILNTVAWNNRSNGWGLSGKTSGARCDSPAGQIAFDILHHQPTNIIVDVFVAGGEGQISTPGWDVLGPQGNLSSRPWVAPVQP